MSQNDHVIANGSGSTVRADINSALQALASQNSGTSGPGTTYPFQIWANESADELAMRTEANSAWVVTATFTGSTYIPWSRGAQLGTIANLNAAAITENLIMSAKQIRTALATVATASGVDLSAAAGNFIELTGSTGITAFTIAAGATYYVRHTGTAFTLTHNASTLICPTGANITVQPGDCFIVHGRAANQAAITFYQRASGSALVGATAGASQAEQEAASSSTAFVTPSVQQHHPSAAKFYVTADMVGTHDNARSYNVASLTDNGVGLSLITFTTAFSDANYAFGAFGKNNEDLSTNGVTMDQRNSGTKSTTACEVRALKQIADSSGAGQMAAFDPANYSAWGFGDR
jgi:hypothetical protein